MSVILAATALANGNGNFSPQHVNNWTVEVYELQGEGVGSILSGKDNLTLALSRGFMPTVGVDEVAIPYGNETVYVAGRARYEGGTIEVRDYVDADIQNILTAWYSRVYIGVTGGRSNQWGKVGVPKNYKRNASILLSAPDGTSERKWSLEGLWPVQMNFGNLDMASSEIVQVAISMRYDRAYYNGKQ